MFFFSFFLPRTCLYFEPPRQAVGSTVSTVRPSGAVLPFPAPGGLPVRQQKRRRDFTNSLHRQQAHSYILPLDKTHGTGYNEKRAQLYLLCGRGLFSCIGPDGCSRTLPACLFCCLIDIIQLFPQECNRAFPRKSRGSEGKRKASPAGGD